MSPAPMRTMPTSRAALSSVAAALVLVCILGACASSGARKRAERQPAPAKTQTPAPAPESTMGPRTPAAAEPAVADATQPPPAPAEPTTDAPSAAAEPPRPAPSASARAPGASRDDGRPNWWFADARREDGRVALCAEALGADMATARDASLQAARARMRQELGLTGAAAIPGERIERAWVWPLPNSKVGPSRYAGYVWISAMSAHAE